MKRKDFISIIICILCAIIIGFGSIGIYKIITEPAQNEVEVEEENFEPTNETDLGYKCMPVHIDVYYN